MPKLTKRIFSWPRLFALVGLGLLIALSLRHPLRAQSVGQGFKTDQTLQRGMIVRIKPTDNTKVETVASDHVGDMYGVVINLNEAAITISDGSQQVFVATTGQYGVLVSNQAGNIKTGDYITASSVAGIGMKAGSADDLTVGRALGNFDGQSNILSTADIQDSSGSKHNINIGLVTVDVAVTHNPVSRGGSTSLPGFLRQANESIAGKPVSAWRVWVATAIFVVATIMSASMLFSGIRSSILSIGRNPLSKKSILRSMIQVIIGGLIIFLTGVFAVYLILRI